MQVVNTDTPSYEVVKSGIAFHGSGSLTLSNVTWVKTGPQNAMEAWLEIPPNKLAKSTMRQCDQIWGAFVRTRDASSMEWCNSQILPTGIKVPLVPPEYLAHKRSKYSSKPTCPVFKLSRGGYALLTKLTWVVNELCKPSEDEMTQSIYTTPDFLRQPTSLMRTLDAATAIMAGEGGGDILYSPELVAVANVDELMALRYNGHPVGGFALQLWHATNERRVDGITTDAAAQNREGNVDVEMGNVA